MRTSLAVLFLLSAIQAAGADVWTLPPFTTSPADVYDAAAKYSAPADADILLIDLDVTFSIDEAGRLTKKRRAIFRVVTDVGGKQLAQITEPWLAWRQSKPVVQARVITSDKRPHVLDPTTITEAGVPGANEMFMDVRILQAPLPAIGAGSIVELEIETADRESVMPGARFDEYALALPYPVHHFVATIQAGKTVRAEALGFEKIAREQQSPSRVRFEAWDMKKNEVDVFLPPESPRGPQIILSTAQSWQTVARWYSELTEPTLAKAATGPVISGDREKTIASILAGIQKNVRYTGLELGMGAYQPRTPAETLTRGYGDCKDKATILISRLRSAGIPAQYALITPYPFPDVVAGLPGMETFNHVIVYLPGKIPRWIDPTSEFTPATRLPLGDQGRNALIVDPQTTQLTRTPESGPNENFSESEMTIRLQAQSKANFYETETFSGAVEEFIRSAFRSVLTSPAMKEQAEKQIIRRLIAEKITSFDSDIPSSFDKPFEIRVTGEGLAQGMTEGQSAVATVALDPNIFGTIGQLAVAEKDEEKTEEKNLKPPRKEDYYLPVLGRAETRQIVIPPPGFRVKQVPEVHDILVAGARLERTASLRPDNAVVITNRYTMPKQRFTVAEAEAIATELKKAESGTGLRIEFVDQVKQLLSEGKDREALELSRERVAASPKSAEALTRLAATLSALGANSDAIDTCLRATALDPKSSKAFAQLGDLYSSDEAGRMYRAGMRRGKAIEALQRAMELDPKNEHLAVKLSGLYTFSDKGIYAGKGADVGKAIDTLLTIKKNLGKLNALNALPNDLLFDHRYAEVKALYAMGEEHDSIVYRLAAIAASETPEAAIAAFNASATNERREETFQKAAELLVQIREYPAAAFLLREALKDETAGGQADADLLAQTRPRAEAKFSKEAPIALTQHLIYALLDPDDVDSWKELYIPESRYMNLRGERNQVWLILAAYHQIGKIRLAGNYAADVAISNGVFASEGSPETGFRVRIADPANNGVMKTVAWVVKRGAAYQILGGGNDLSAAGREALAAVGRGDLKAAKEWLDWIREEIPSTSSTDPLATLPFAKLWPTENSGSDEAKAAAASLAIRGRKYGDGLATLRDSQKHFSSGPFRNAIDEAVVQGLFIHQLFADALPEARRLLEKYPDSDSAFSNLAFAESHAGAIHRTTLSPAIAKRLEKDPNAALALRTEARVFESQARYADAVTAYTKLSHTSKVTASDWNGFAWTSLYTDQVGPAALDAANNASRLTQNRNPSIFHTLGCVKAATGDTAGARKLLFQYLDTSGEFDDAAHLLLGLIDEKLGLTAAARHTYQEIEKQEVEIPISSYALARKQLAHLDVQLSVK